MTDVDYMKIALRLSLKGKGRTSPNPMVGAVVVKNNRIIAQGFHRYCGADHAEVAALKKAGARARAGKLYVTLEPCGHFGRTPPCVDRIIESGIQEVVVGIIDPNPLNNGKSILKLRRAGIKVKVGFLTEELTKLNEFFIKFIKYKMPFVVVKWAQTLDGKIAARAGQSQWITSQQARNYAHRLRNDFDAIMVGINTVLNDNPNLNAARQSKRIKKIVIDSGLRIPREANLFKNTNPQDVIVATTSKASQRKITQLAKRGVQIIVCPSRDGRVNLQRLCRELARRGITSIIIEGGSGIIGSALKERLVDKIAVFVAPKIIGDEEAVSAVRGFHLNHVDQAIVLKDMSVRRIDSDILIEGYVHGNH